METLRSVNKKVTIVGGSNCGKDALLTAYTKGKFYYEADTSIFSEYVAKVDIASIKVWIKHFILKIGYYNIYILYYWKLY